MPDNDSGLFSSIRSYASEYVSAKRRQLNAKPQTQVEGAGTDTSVTFSGQDISQGDMRDVKQMRESGGIVSQAFHSKALIKFGTGIDIQAEDDGLEDWLHENVGHLDDLVLDLGEDCLWYPYALGEIVETQTGNFSHIEMIEPWTMLPVTDEYGDILYWEQHLDGSYGDVPQFEPDEIGMIVLNKSSGRDKTGISEALRSEEEIETFRSNQQAMRQATERIGYPFVHARAGREGATQLNDTELRRVRNRLAKIGPGETQVTGPDVDIDLKEPATVDFGKIQERDMRMLATSLGIPVELLNEGSDGLGSGMPAELRKDLLSLQNQADRRRFSEQFIEQFLKPIVRDYAPFDHTMHMKVVFEPFLEDQTEKASLVQSVGDYMTVNEVRERLGLSEVEDEELGESYESPGQAAQQEQPEEDMGGGIDQLFSDGRVLAVSDVDTSPTAGMQTQAQNALDWKEETGNPNDCGTQVGWERANQIVNGENLSEDTINRMKSFFARHDEPSPDEPKADCGRMMWKAWGGDPGQRWAEGKVEEFDTARENAALAKLRDLAVPDNAVSIQDPAEAPEGANIVRGDRDGLYYIPQGEEATDTEDITERSNPDGTIDVDKVRAGDKVLKGGDEITIVGTEKDEIGTLVGFTEEETGEEYLIYDDMLDDFEVPGADVEPDEGPDVDGDDDAVLSAGDDVLSPSGNPATVVAYDENTDCVLYETEDGEELLTTREGLESEEIENETDAKTQRVLDETNLPENVSVGVSSMAENQVDVMINGLNEFDSLVGIDNADLFTITDTPQDDVGSAAGAAYHTGQRSLYVNPDEVDRETRQQEFDAGFLATETPEGSIYHEMMHAKHTKNVLSSEELGLDELRAVEFDDETSQLIEEEVSTYAATNATEFVAEVGSAQLERGVDFSDEVLELYEQYGGPEVAK